MQAVQKRSAWSVFPEGLGCCWESCSAADLAQLRATCTEDAALFKPLLIAGLLQQLRTCRKRQGRCTAMIALRRFGNSAAPALLELSAAMKDVDEQVRRQAALTLGSIFAQASESVPVLLQSLRDEANCVRIATLRALSSLGVEAVHTAVPIAEMLEEEENESVREAAVRTLGSLAISARPSGNEASTSASSYVTSIIVAHLLEALADEDWCVRKACAEAVGRLLSEHHMQDFIDACLPQLLTRLADDDEDVRAAVAAALGSCAAVSVSALHTLAAALEDRHFEVRSAAVKAFSRLGAAALPAEPAIVKLLTHELSGIRETAATVLGMLGRPTAPSISALVAVLADESVFVRMAASRALGELSSWCHAALPEVADLLHNTRSGVRQISAETLAVLKVPLSSALVADLERLALEDSDWSVREASLATLSKLKPDLAGSLVAM